MKYASRVLRCPRCGYDLAVLLEPFAEVNCPECGTKWSRLRIERLNTVANAAWPCWVVAVLLSAFVLWSVAQGAGRAGLFGLQPRSPFPGTSLEVRDAVALGGPALWGMISLIATIVFSHLLRKAGRRGQALSMRLVGVAFILLGGSAWALFSLFAIGMSRIPPP